MHKTKVATVTQRTNGSGRTNMIGAWGGVLLVLQPAEPDEDGNPRWNVYLRPRSQTPDELTEEARENMEEARAARREGHDRRANRHGAAARIARRKAEGIVELGGRD